MPHAHAAVLAAGLLVLLSACAPYYENRCAGAGQPGSAEMRACIGEAIARDRENRREHMSFGRGGAGG